MEWTAGPDNGGLPRLQNIDVMISLDLARQLKSAGLIWDAQTNDFFAIPERDMDNRVFVLADMMSNLDVFRGWPVVTFHGAAEWALDYILTAEVVWMPTEEQLRDRLVDELLGEQTPRMQLELTAEGYRCALSFQEMALTFDAADASEAYGQALLHVLQNK